MAHPLGAHVDGEALRDIAGRFGAISDELAQVSRRQLDGLLFGGVMAGRAHGVRGEALRNAVDALGKPLRTWARATDEIAVELRTAAADYRRADARAGARVG